MFKKTTAVWEVVSRGLEPLTSTVAVYRSNQLSYETF